MLAKEREELTALRYLVSQVYRYHGGIDTDYSGGYTFSVGWRDSKGWHGLSRDGEWVCEYPHPESQEFASREDANMALVAWGTKHGVEDFQKLREKE